MRGGEAGIGGAEDEDVEVLRGLVDRVLHAVGA